MQKSIEKIIKRHHFWTAFEMLCDKIGEAHNYHRLIRGHDVDARSTSEKPEFIRKITRILAYNYNVHQCPPPGQCPRILPAENELPQPVIYPPEYRQKQ
jgi:hypothetical protein